LPGEVTGIVTGKETCHRGNFAALGKTSQRQVREQFGLLFLVVDDALHQFGQLMS